jgi:hypothetical protein
MFQRRPRFEKGETHGACVGPCSEDPNAMLVDMELEDRSPRVVDRKGCQYYDCYDPDLSCYSPSKRVLGHRECGCRSQR